MGTVVEDAVAHISHRPWDRDADQPAAAEGGGADGESGIELDAGQRGAVGEGIVTDGAQVDGGGDFRERGAAVESVGGDSGDEIAVEGCALQAGAMGEYVVTDGAQVVRERGCEQAAAAMKGAAADGLQRAVFDEADRGELGAVMKSMIPDRFDGGGDVDGGEAAAVEGGDADIGDGGWEGHRAQGGTVSEGIGADGGDGVGGAAAGDGLRNADASADERRREGVVDHGGAGGRELIRHGASVENVGWEYGIGYLMAQGIGIG